MSKKDSSKKTKERKSREFHTAVPCQCGRCEADYEAGDETSFICAVCCRTMPNCYGAADDNYEACDECVADPMVINLLVAQDMLLTAGRPTVASILEARGALARALFARGAEVARRPVLDRVRDETLRGLAHLKDLLTGSRSADALHLAATIVGGLIEMQQAAGKGSAE